MPCRYWAAAPSAIDSAIAGVPASNFQGRSFQVVFSSCDRADHLAAGQKRRHLLEQLGAAPEDAGAGAAHLVAGEGVEVAAQRLNVDRAVGGGLRAVDDQDGAAIVGPRGQRRDVVDGAERVGDVGDGDQLDVLDGGQALLRVGVEAAVVGQAQVVQRGAGLLGEELPRHQVRVVLHLGGDDRITGADEGAAVGIGDQVQGLGRLAHEDHLAAIAGVDEPGHDVARALVALGGTGAEVVDAAMDVGVGGLVDVDQRLDHLTRLLRRRRRIEEYQPLAVHGLGQDRKVGADLLEVERSGELGDCHSGSVDAPAPRPDPSTGAHPTGMRYVPIVNR